MYEVLKILRKMIKQGSSFTLFRPRETSPAAKSEEKRMFSQANFHVVEETREDVLCARVLGEL